MKEIKFNNGSLEIQSLGDSAVIIQFGQEINLETHQKVKILSHYLEAYPFPGMIEYIPAFTSVTVFYDPWEVYKLHLDVKKFQSLQEKILPYAIVHTLMQEIIKKLSYKENYHSKTVQIPVCYEQEFGPDLDYVAEYNGLTPNEVIEIHSSKEYLVYMIGFAPGFPYLGGMPEQIATPRKSSPRLVIPAGSIGIAGTQTGAYPIETPGGWQLIGRTPISLFRPAENPPTLLQAGDLVKFIPITHDEYDRWKKEEK